MAYAKISVTVDADVLRDVRKIMKKGETLSSIVDAGLRQHVQRLRMTALLDEMDARNPISAEEQRAGEALRAEIESSWTQERSPRSRPKRAGSA